MAQLRTIQTSESPDSIWADLVYTEARMMSDPIARDLAPEHSALIERTLQMQMGQRAAWRDEIVAQASIDATDGSLNRLTQGFGLTLKGVERGQKTPRFRRYFPKNVTTIVKLALGRHVAAVSAWPESLKGEKEEALQAYAPQFAKLVEEGEKALKARTTANGRRADHRARDITDLVDDINAARTRALGRLLQRGVKHGLPKDWAESFFRSTQRRVEAAEPEDDDGGEEGGEG